MNKSILNLAVPNIISNITVPLLGMVDLALMGHLGSPVYIGAIGLGSVVFNVLYLSLGFLRMGTTGFTAQAFGRNDNQEIAYGLYRPLFIAISLALLLIVLQIPIEKISFYLLDGTREVKTLAREYFYIRIFAAPATLGLMALMGWFVGMQNTKIPMVLSIFINLLNIGFNVFFVKVMKMDVAGVALGTLMAQYGGLGLGILLLFKYYRVKLLPIRKEVVFQLEQLQRFFRVNTDILIRSIALILTLSFFTSESAGLGNDILAINSLMLQYFFVFSYFMDGFAFAGEALVGKFTGSNDKQRIKKTIKYLFFWGLGLSLPFMLAYGLFNSELINLLTNDPDLLDYALIYKWWMIIIPVSTFAAFIWDGVYIGATASVSMRNTMLIAAIAVFLPTWYFGLELWNNHGLWLAFHLFMLSRGALMTLFAKKALNI